MTKYNLLRNGEEIGETTCPLLAMRIDGLKVHQTAFEPHDIYEYHIEETDTPNVED